MKRSLSDRLLRSLARPQVTPREVWDQQLRGFGCRASRRGVVSFFTMRRPAGSSKPVRLTFGNFPAMSLLEARQRARALLTELQDGVDPRVRRAEEARVAAAEKASTFGNVAEVFISRHLKTKRTARTIERLIRRELIPRWGERPIAGIARADVIALIDEIVDRGCPEMARVVFAYVRRLFGWAVPRCDLQHAPTDHVSIVDLVGAKKPRQRVLDDRELELIWRATEGPQASYYGPFTRLLLLTGVRRAELGRATWSEFDVSDAALWTIPPGRMKSEDPHRVPLAPAALTILRSLPQGDGYVIGGAPIHYSRAKGLLDTRIASLNDGRPLPRWTWHDCRRTFRTTRWRRPSAAWSPKVGHAESSPNAISDRKVFVIAGSTSPVVLARAHCRLRSNCPTSPPIMRSPRCRWLTGK
jgi:integrase